MKTSDRCPAVGGVRYAPSPTGPLHVGNLRTAWISEFIARRMGLPWVVRFEDIDRPRVREGSMIQQGSDLAALKLIPDHTFVQSSFIGRHWTLFLAAVDAGRVYPCSCSRQDVLADLASMASASHSGGPPAYSGRCRDQGQKLFNSRQNIAWRFRHPNPRGTEDFVIARGNPELVKAKVRGDFTPSYHWACTIDDMDGDHQVIVRAVDLLHAAKIQRQIQELIVDLEPGRLRHFSVIFHTALVTDNHGHRLEKRTQGATLADLDTKGVSLAAIQRGLRNSFDGRQTDDIWEALHSKSPATLFESRREVRLSDLIVGHGESPQP